MPKYLFHTITLSLLLLSCGKNSSSDFTNYGNTTFSYNHNLYPGSSSRDFLRSTIYKSLQIEIQYMPGFKPEISSINLLTEFVNARLNKPDGITIHLKEINPTLKTVFSINDIAETEKQNRTAFTSGNQLACYFLLIDGSYDNGSVLALSYKNTSICLFGDPFKYFSIGSSEDAKSNAMAMLMEHEFGHLIGLVEMGSSMVANHLDPENNNHCIYSHCLMHHSFESQTRLFEKTFTEIPGFDSYCLNDLRANGGK